MKRKPNSIHIIHMIQSRDIDNPIYSKEIERRLGVNDVQVRDAVHRARVIDNIPLGSGSTGYFMPRDRAEAIRTIASLRSRAKQNLEAADGIDQFYKEEDQMRLL